LITFVYINIGDEFLYFVGKREIRGKSVMGQDFNGSMGCYQNFQIQRFKPRFGGFQCHSLRESFPPDMGFGSRCHQPGFEFNAQIGFGGNDCCTPPMQSFIPRYPVNNFAMEQPCYDYNENDYCGDEGDYNDINSSINNCGPNFYGPVYIVQGNPFKNEVPQQYQPEPYQRYPQSQDCPPDADYQRPRLLPQTRRPAARPDYAPQQPQTTHKTTPKTSTHKPTPKKPVHTETKQCGDNSNQNVAVANGKNAKATAVQIISSTPKTNGEVDTQQAKYKAMEMLRNGEITNEEFKAVFEVLSKMGLEKSAEPVRQNEAPAQPPKTSEHKSEPVNQSSEADSKKKPNSKQFESINNLSEGYADLDFNADPHKPDQFIATSRNNDNEIDKTFRVYPDGIMVQRTNGARNFEANGETYTVGSYTAVISAPSQQPVTVSSDEVDALDKLVQERVKILHDKLITDNTTKAAFSRAYEQKNENVN